MSALVIEKVAGGPRCVEPGCKRSGRYRFRIAGHYFLRDAHTGRKALICKHHAGEMQALWDELAGVSE